MFDGVDKFWKGLWLLPDPKPKSECISITWGTFSKYVFLYLIPMFSDWVIYSEQKFTASVLEAETSNMKVPAYGKVFVCVLNLGVLYH